MPSRLSAAPLPALLPAEAAPLDAAEPQLPTLLIETRLPSEDESMLARPPPTLRRPLRPRPRLSLALSAPTDSVEGAVGAAAVWVRTGSVLLSSESAAIEAPSRGGGENGIGLSGGASITLGFAGVVEASCVASGAAEGCLASAAPASSLGLVACTAGAAALTHSSGALSTSSNMLLHGAPRVFSFERFFFLGEGQWGQPHLMRRSSSDGTWVGGAG